MCCCNLFEIIKYTFIFKPPIIDKTKESPYDSIISSKNGNKISYKMFEPSNDTYTDNSKYVIWCHGNSDTIESETNRMIRYSDYLNVKIVYFDYQGYGYSEGNPSEENCYSDLYDIVNFLISNGINKKDIYLIGRSLGTGVISGYAYRNEWKSDIILISPFKSILRVVIDFTNKVSCDNFNTYDISNLLMCPVKIIHGENDTTINVSHSIDIYKKLNDKKYYPSYVTDANHHDILSKLNWSEIYNIIHE
jgi:pimeloyl-ACP methyl ester carboxylesterase